MGAYVYLTMLKQNATTLLVLFQSGRNQQCGHNIQAKYSLTNEILLPGKLCKTVDDQQNLKRDCDKLASFELSK